MLVKEKFLNETEETNLLDYVCNFKQRLSKACELAHKHLQAAQADMKAKYDRRTEARSFKPGDKVLVLLPLQGDPLSAKFSGPYTIEKKLNEVNYVVVTPDRRKTRRVCHVNMLKPYFEREDPNAPKPIASVVSVNPEPKEDDSATITLEPVEAKLENSDSLQNLDVTLDYLPSHQKKRVITLLREFNSIFSDVPGRTSLATHDVDVDLSNKQPYRLNPTKLEQVRTEIKYMLEHDLIEPSNSSWSSPVVLQPKPDGTVRLCIDYRKVNAVSVSDSCPFPRIEDCIDKIGKAKFLTKIDLFKGYWQVPLTERAKEISAFVTPDGLIQCKVMQFGMKNAPPHSIVS